MVQADRDDSRNESHVQEGFGRQLKDGILIYAGNDHKQIYLNWQSGGLTDQNQSRVAKKLLQKRSDSGGKIQTVAKQL